MDVRNCPRCGKIFNRLRRDICPVCVEEEDRQYEIVREYIYDNPKVDVQTVSKETEVPVDTILKFLRENRLVNVSGNLILDCENCGAAISSGRFCEVCIDQLEKEIGGLAPKTPATQETKKSGASFHFMKDRLDKKR